MRRSSDGLTLVELIIVVGIIGIISAISLPAYHNYADKSASAACLAEAKSYSNLVYLTLNDQTQTGSIPSPHLGACRSITDASTWTSATQQRLITAVPKSSNNLIIECDLPNGVPCKLKNLNY